MLTQDRLIVAGNVIQGCFNSVLLWQTAATAARVAGRAGELSDMGAKDNEEVLGLLTSVACPFTARHLVGM